MFSEDVKHDVAAPPACCYPCVVIITATTKMTIHATFMHPEKMDVGNPDPFSKDPGRIICLS